MIRHLIVGALFSWMVHAAAHAAPLIDASGKLTGATVVDVGGAPYDVDFVDGTCVGLFSGCDSAADFAFTTTGAAEVAAAALRDQVFLDGPLGAFDSHPERTTGCEGLAAAFECIIQIPFANFGSAVGAIYYRNNMLESFDDIGDTAIIPTADTGVGNVVFAVFRRASRPTPPSAPLPVPGTVAMVGVGLIGLVFSWRRGNSARAVNQ